MVYSAMRVARLKASGSSSSARYSFLRLTSFVFQQLNWYGDLHTLHQSSLGFDHHPGRRYRSRITAATPSMSRRLVPLASPQSVRATVSTLGSIGTVSPPLVVALVLPPHLIVVDPARFGDDDGEEVDGAFELFDGGLKPREDVPRYSGGEARVDDPLILLHRPNLTLRGGHQKAPRLGGAQLWATKIGPCGPIAKRDIRLLATSLRNWLKYPWR